MLNTFRRNQTSIFGLVVVAFICMLMVGFGMSFNFGRKDSQTVASVDGETIAYQEFYRRKELLTNQFRQQFPGNFEQIRSFLNIGQQALDSMVNEKLLGNFFDEAHFVSGQKQIEGRILSHPYFRRGFSEEAYQNFLRNIGMTGVGLEAAVAKEINQEQLNSTFSQLLLPTESELRSLYTSENTEYSFRYLEFKDADFRDKVNTSDEAALRAYYDEHKELFRKPRAVSFVAVPFLASDFQDKVELSDEDIATAYEEHQIEYREPPKVALRHIFFSKDEDKESPLGDLLKSAEDDQAQQSKLSKRDAAKASAEATLKRIQDGEDFATVARERSEDKQSAEKGGEMGMLPYDALQPAVATAVQGLEPGDHSAVLETSHGFEIVLVEDKVEGRLLPLSDVRDRVVSMLKANDAPLYAFTAAEEFHRIFNETDGAELKSLAEKKGLKVIAEEKPVAATEPTTNAELPPGFVAKFVDNAEGDTTLIELGQSTYLVTITKAIEAHIQPFEDVRETVETQFRSIESAKLAEEFGKQLLAEMFPEKKSADEKAAGAAPSSEKPAIELAALAKKHQLETKETEKVTRQNAQGELFASPDVISEAFALSSDRPMARRVFDLGERHVLVELIDTTPPDTAGFQEKRGEIFRSAIGQSGTRSMGALLAVLKKRATVDINTEFLRNQS